MIIFIMVIIAIIILIIYDDSINLTRAPVGAAEGGAVVAMAWVHGSIFKTLVQGLVRFYVMYHLQQFLRMSLEHNFPLSGKVARHL